ncbi:hypothetical protein TVAG_424080 [Trichomonas vaginalis G3]|uniref:Uncharacterized protein n=1 Tax=Trichomonas vaginalis (strain ATCC PRA-98 / G3) TaxID=412133 RepID=A2E1P8_TRIV3|nr:hypothetical protein TVAGG3_0304130 [Trichomonas vaginalis G3]EAY13377.1 hypothetical protein TVAG_424080 [Trichomonas vaginalis G3]KAI5528130.1 hypothetical protein TVAGG3_0304130 [Trichomonas vaginalis G3]|eukprot:XP_001325600.1 hypothetical protein [Trichomonas vaginalis G3]
MFALFANHALCDKLITQVGAYAQRICNVDLDIKFDLEDNPMMSYYMILVNPPSGLRVNQHHQLDPIFEIKPKSYVTIHTEDWHYLKYFIVRYPRTCLSVEFLLNSRMGQKFIYNATDRTMPHNGTYCSAFVSFYPIDIHISTETPSVLFVDNYSINEFKFRTNKEYNFENVYSVCIGFRPQSFEPDQNVVIEITRSFIHFEEEVFTFTSYFNYFKKKIFAESASDFNVPKDINLKPGVYYPDAGVNSPDYHIKEHSYVVFTLFDDCFGYVRSGLSLLEILGNTNIVSVYFNTSGVMSFYSYQSCAPLHFVVYDLDLTDISNVITNCNNENLKFESTKGERNVLVSAYYDGMITISSSSDKFVESYNYSGQAINESLVGYSFYSIVSQAENSKKSEWIKLKFSGNFEGWQNYLIEGKNSYYKAYSINDSCPSKRLNSGN